MTSKSFRLPDDVYDYVLAHGVREPEILARLREETADPSPRPDADRPATRARSSGSSSSSSTPASYVEVGTFTGYSSLAVALAMPPDGTPRLLRRVRGVHRASRAATGPRPGSRTRLDLRIGPGVDELDALLAEGRGNTFDLAFIDADKKSLPRLLGALRALAPARRRRRAGQRPVGRRDRGHDEPRPGHARPAAVNELVRDDERVTGAAAGRGRDDARAQALTPTGAGFQAPGLGGIEPR